MEINHWWTTRPKRKLVTMADVLRSFLAVAEGRRWSANRSLHIEFEDSLERTEIKTEGERRDRGGSGGRTYAAWLYSFGLWFEDSHDLVRPTLAGSDLLKSNPVTILSHQLLTFQYPSAFSKKTRVSDRFRIRPFRFILKLLVDSRLGGYLTKTELARFVITHAESDRDLDRIVSLIRIFRLSGAGISDEELARIYGDISKLEDTANTFVNQLEYTQLIRRTNGEGSFYIREDRIDLVVEILKNEPRFVDRADEPENFQRKYGLGPDHQKDTRTFGRSPFISSVQAENTKVLVMLADLLSVTPINEVNASLLRTISEQTGIELRRVEIIVSESELKTVSLEAFEQKYIEMSLSGTALAKEFERTTAGIFGSEGLGFVTKWIGPKPNHPDILTISLDSSNSYSGIIDTKAYSEYTINGDHRRRMTDEYIPKFLCGTFQRENIPRLEFFSYIAGGFGSTFDSGVERISSETGVGGFGMTATEVLAMLKLHRIQPFTKGELRRAFVSNKRILASDLR